MAETNGNGNGNGNGRSWMAGVLIPISVATAGFLAQVLWFSAQYGQTTAKLEQLDHRTSNIESLGSPALAGIRPQVEEATRRLIAIEQVLPTIQQTQSQITVNTRRLDSIEHIVPEQVQALFVTDARQISRLEDVKEEVGRLREWRVNQVQINQEMAKALTALQTNAKN